MEKLFSTQEAADFLKVTTRTIRNWKQLGKLFPRKTELGKLPKSDFDAEYLRLIKCDIAQAQANLDNLPERERRGLTLNTLRHFSCGYLTDWVLTKSRAEFSCGLYIKENGEPKHLPPPSARIIIPTKSMEHINGVATSSARFTMNKNFWKQHAGKMELFCDADALNSDLIIIVEGEIDAMSIWQAFGGNIAVVAILGCGNWKKTLLPKLNDLRSKRLLLLFDADAAGKKSAKKFLAELLNRGCFAVTKYIYDALPKEEQIDFGWKVDANSILQNKGNVYLKSLLEKIIENAEKDFKILEEQAAKWKQLVKENNAQTAPEPSLPIPKTKRHSPSDTNKDTIDATTDDNIDREEIKLIMKDFVHAKNLTRDDWRNVGMILKRYGFFLEDFQNWSKDDSRYSAEICATQWNSFKTAEELNGKGYTVATLIQLAKQFDYQPQKKILVRKDFNGYDFLQDTVEDLDNARRLEKYRGKYIRWLTDDELWLTFDDGIWSRRSEKSSCLYPFATRFADEMMSFAKILAIEADDAAKASVIINDDSSIQRIDEQAKKKADIANTRRDKAFAIAYYFKKRKNYSAAIDLLKGCDSILITADDLNRHKNLLCVKNGVIDLETGKLYPLDPKYLITNQADVFFDPNADIAFVDKFFSEVIPDEQTRQGVWRYLGYCLTGEKIYHICQFWRGRGANGKTTILDMLIQLFGSYAIKLPTNALLESMRPLDANAASPALAMLDGDIRLAILDEIPRNCRLDATTFKTIIGDQFITARPLYGNPRKIELRAKLILNGNHLPNFDVDDGGLQRRINNVEYTQFFPADRADVTLPAKLTTLENRSALLNILLNHAQNFYRDGLIESDDMKAAKAEYFNENDFVANFVDEYCIIGEGGEIKRKDFEAKLISAYPSETSRLKKKDLLRITTERLNFLGAKYMQDRHRNNLFRNIKWQS